MHAHETGHDHRHDEYVEAIHLTEVEDVEECADADRVHGVLPLRGNPLRIKVLLRHITGEGSDDRHQKGDHAGDPGQASAISPRSLEEGGPQVDDHKEEERLGGPEMQAVEEVPHRCTMPP